MNALPPAGNELPSLVIETADSSRLALLHFLSSISSSSRKAMQYVLQELADRLGLDDVPIEEVPWLKLDPSHVAALLSRMRDDGLAPSTASLYISAIRGIFNAGFVRKQIDGDTLARIRAVKSYRGKRLARGKNLKRNLIRDLMSACDNDDKPQGVRDAALIAILYGSGMRKAESVRFTVTDIDFEAGTIRVIGKNNKEMLKFLPPWVIERVQRWLALREQKAPGCEFLFNRIYRGGRIGFEPLGLDGVYFVVTQRGKEVGVKITPHDFRRSFITRIIDEHDLSIAMKLADHSNISTTARYDMRDNEKKKQVMTSFDL